MGKLLKGELTTAIRMIERNKGRSMLTMFGIVIGVAAVVTVIGIGQGVELQIREQTQQFGKDLITVRPGQVTSGQTINDVLASFGKIGSVQAGGALSDGDLAVVQKTKGVGEALPLRIVASGVVTAENNKHYDVPVIGADASLPTLLNQNLAYGSFFEPGDAGASKVILGSHMAQALFQQNVPLGQALEILGQEFIVTGIFSDFQAIPFSGDIDFNNAVFISNEQAQLITKDHAQIYEMLVRPTQPKQIDATVDQLNGTLLAAHGGQHDFTVLKQSQTILVANSILHLLTLLIIGVAAIALLVGGVGVMNVMLVSVTERMHEIGIRKAIGATNAQILLQFLIEAAVLSISGAVGGIAVAYALAIGLRLFTDLTPVISWEVALISCVIAVFIGMMFGSAPALKAARKEPISALRNE